MLTTRHFSCFFLLLMRITTSYIDTHSDELPLCNSFNTATSKNYYVQVHKQVLQVVIRIQTKRRVFGHSVFTVADSLHLIRGSNAQGERLA
jgi:hypothetical protein